MQADATAEAHSFMQGGPSGPHVATLMSDILEAYEKDLLHRAGLKQADILFLEPDDIYGEVKHRIELERCKEIRGLLQLTSLKGLTTPWARILYAAGITTRWEFLNLEAGKIVEQVNENTEETWGEKEQKKVARVHEQNAELMDEI